jgi:hypothetical protein
MRVGATSVRPPDLYSSSKYTPPQDSEDSGLLVEDL